ncbi:Porphobilinogen deaminase [Flavobacterium longum]|uniref:hydroxymethylbilane synthase n=1 Tax=Flavobacterium longum TaxID=1299340 RepID=UPI0039ED16BB
MANKTIRIGTRDSQLALWQAYTVEKKLNDLGYDTQVIPIKSAGDLILDKPLYEFGITGIFTKTLDVAMISGQVDIAVHSMKDVPTALPKGIVQAAVLERENSKDILVFNAAPDFTQELTIATGSLRRQAQWLNRYPHHNVVDLRGNVNTRLQKLADNDWGGAVFATAGLDRLGIKPENHIDLDWMIPAPAQGAMVVVAMQEDAFCVDAVSKLNHLETDICTLVEREFLRTLEGGCTAPIGALATVIGNDIRFEGLLCSVDGQEKIHIEKTTALSHGRNGFGRSCAEEILANGGASVMEKIKRDLGK